MRLVLLVLLSLVTEDTSRAAGAPHPFAFPDLVAMQRDQIEKLERLLAAKG